MTAICATPDASVAEEEVIIASSGGRPFRAVHIPGPGAETVADNPTAAD
jgi:hypothetical protein